jgi:thiamine kinase-like enzyme
MPSDLSRDSAVFHRTECNTELSVIKDIAINQSTEWKTERYLSQTETKKKLRAKICRRFHQTVGLLHIHKRSTSVFIDYEEFMLQYI